MEMRSRSGNGQGARVTLCAHPTYILTHTEVCMTSTFVVNIFIYCRLTTFMKDTSNANKYFNFLVGRYMRYTRLKSAGDADENY
jgi:hypothetical protein